MAEFFASKGFEMPVGYAVADWALEVSQVYSTEILKERGFDIGDGMSDLTGAMVGLYFRASFW